MSIGIGNEHEVSPFQVVLGANEVLRVTANGQFVWNPDADRMIEEGDFSSSPAMPYILRALRKREWVGLTDDEIEKGRDQTFSINNPYCPCDSKTMRKAVRWAEAKLKEKNG
jgi:hypothetical protein